MATFALQLRIEPQDLAAIAAAGQNIVIARGFADSASNVAWASFPPFPSNSVSWDAGYGLYAATLPTAHVQPQSRLAGAASGMYYTFGPQPPLFNGPSSGSAAPPAGSYRVVNKVQDFPSMAFGLTLSVIANGIASSCNPATLQIVPANQFATFTPLATVYVWLQSGITAGDVVVLPPPPGVSLVATSFCTKVQFVGPGTLTYQYSATLGAFVPST